MPIEWGSYHCASPFHICVCLVTSPFATYLDFQKEGYIDIVMYMYACICIQGRKSGGMLLQNRCSEIASGAILEQK